MLTTRRTVGPGVAALLIATVLVGCVPTSGGAAGRLERGLDSAHSAAATAHLALRQLREGDTVPSDARTVVDDALTSAQEEQRTLGTLDPVDARERSWRAAADGAFTALDAALKDARSAASGSAGIRWSTALAELDRAEQRIEQARAVITRQAGDHA
ncbi:MAG TPA: hypothetical protein VGC45_11405 [Gryllotalpicola sp.]